MHRLALPILAALASLLALPPAAALADAPADAPTAASSSAPLLTLRGGADPRIQRGIDLAYNLHFEAAEAYFDSLTAVEPDNPAGHFFSAMVATAKDTTPIAQSPTPSRLMSPP